MTCSTSPPPFHFTEAFRAFAEENSQLVKHSFATVSNKLNRSNHFRYLHMSKGSIYPYASPAFVTDGGLADLKEATKRIVDCYEDLAQRMKADPALMENLLPGLDETTKRGFLLDHGYRRCMPIYRLDLTMTDRGIQMMEINTGCPGGELDGGLIGRYFLEGKMLLPFRAYLKGKYEFSFFDPREDSLLRLLECYAEFRANSGVNLPEMPTIGLITSTPQAYYLMPECRGIAQYYRERGYSGLVGDLLDIRSRKGEVTLQGKPVHLIFRKFSTDSFFRRMDPEKGILPHHQRERVQDLHKALSNREVCMVNPLSSTVMQDKGLLASVREEYPQLRDLLPEAYILSPDLLDRHSMVADRIRAGKEFILKRRVSYGGKWVRLAPSDIRRDFDSLLDKEANRWIAQRRIELPKGFFFYVHNARHEMGTYYFNINSFGESFFLRVSPGDRNTPINASHGGAASSLIGVLLAS
jgi:glutathionylspermidine synthase